jgi:LacI family transcriptional regulator
MAVTVKDIARRTGFSPATVSMVMNSRPGIGEDVRLKILAAAKALGYEKQKRSFPGYSKSLNLVMYKKHGDVVNDNPFFAELTQGIELSTRKNGWNLLISYYYESQNHAEQISAINASSCRGIILLATEMYAGDLTRFSSLSVPMVLLDNTFDDPGLDSITINNIQGSMQAVKYLEKLGHRKIGHLKSKAGITNIVERCEGYFKGLSVSPPEKYTVSIAPTSEKAYEDMRAYLASKPEIPSAFFADNDIIAISCIRALREAGYKIPENVSIVGFDDMPACAIIDPPLTSMRVSRQTMGGLAVEQLFKRINKDASENVRIAVNTTLVPRSSTAPYPGPA